VSYSFPITSTYSSNAKWLRVYVGGVPVDTSLVNNNFDSKFELLIDPVSIKAGTTVLAQWLEPIAPIVPTSYKVIPQQPTPPADAEEGDLWFDTSDDTYQGTIFEELSEEISQSAVLIEDRLSGELDDTLRLKRAVQKAKDNGYKKVLLKPGSYEISDTIYCSVEGEKLGITIEGVNAETVEIVVNVTGTKAAFTFEKTTNNPEGWAEMWSNGGLKNLRIRSKSINNTGTAIYLRGSVFAQFENIRISSMNYGIWLHNEGVGIYTEANIFRNFRIDFCNNMIRLEQGTGNESFHGNVFDKIYGNIKPNQIGFNHLSGYLYNAYFDLHLWTQKNSDGSLPTGSARPVIINANGRTKNCRGNFTVEAYSEPVLQGTGYFWFDGTIRGIGGTGQPNIYIDTTVVRSDGKPVFKFNNRLDAVESKSLAANAGVTQTSTFTGSKNGSAPFIASIYVYGTAFEYRRLMWLWYTGSTYNLTATNEVAAFPEITKTGVTITSRWVDANGNFGINIQTDIPLTLEYRAFGLNNVADTAFANMNIS
jgi:hypothetical protein